MYFPSYIIPFFPQLGDIMSADLTPLKSSPGKGTTEDPLRRSVTKNLQMD